MFRFLQDHPFAVDAYFDTSIVLTFAAHTAELRKLVPSRLELDTFQEEWGFVAVAVVQTTGLRPWFMPRLFGNDFILIGYRVFVRYTNKIGKRMRGLYILRSETDSKRMELLGNIFTHYNYSTIDISIEPRAPITTITSEKGGLEITLKTTDEDPPLPEGSPFNTWKEARRYAGPLPFTFTVGPDSVLIIEGVRREWSPRPVEVVAQRIDFLRTLGLKTITLANAFIVEDVPYHWKKGRLEEWDG
jgi:hypothetical protein